MPRFRPPELYEGNSSNYDLFSSDIWALSIVLLMMTTKSKLWKKALQSDLTFSAYTQDKNSIFANTSAITSEAKEVIWASLKLDHT
ncbi:hypothetical protein BC936DRAFT_137807 [Jimgerdemannia flammicorona]|uniref:Protein kinase domain-containing protein n=1 Tax=Jimgerdemannia flammicorona TaxID=994334 RepID=A0A433CWN0_9FUNG|nr:hypothetical protein BC936DRAFT_137807 [Jimgerdemannia flammicorona]